MTPAQCNLLLAVEEAGETSVGEVAAALELDGSTLSRTMDGLVRIDMLSRKEDSTNRRRQLVSLTAMGRESENHGYILYTKNVDDHEGQIAHGKYR